eukprot:1326338-Karenia_brevis.AAC.1
MCIRDSSMAVLLGSLAQHLRTGGTANGEHHGASPWARNDAVHNTHGAGAHVDGRIWRQDTQIYMA